MYLWFAIGVVLAIVALVGAVMAIFSRRAPEGSRSDRTPTDLYAVTAGSMSLLVAFSFSAAFAQFTNVQSAIHNEASAIQGMYRATKFMEQPVQGQIQMQLRCYLDAVSHSEWQQMRDSVVPPGNQVEAAVLEMDNILASKEGQQEAGIGLSNFESATTARASARETRLAAASWVMPPIIFIMILIGALITIGSLFLYADRAKPHWGNALVVIGPVFVLAAAAMVTYFFDHPFVDSPGALKPSAYVATQTFIEYDLAKQEPLQPLNCPPEIMPPSALPEV